MANSASVKVGDFAPDGKLVTKSGTTLQIADLWKNGPVVLHFTRHKG